MKNLFLFLLLFCAGCSSVSDEPRTDEESAPPPEETNTLSDVEIVEPLAEFLAELELPPALSVTNFPPDATTPAPESSAVSASDLPMLMMDEFSVNKDLRLGPVLRALARIADVNIAFGDSVENLGPFRFRLNNPTPWNEVFASILDVYHLSYEDHGKIITVMTLDDMNQRYDLEKQKSDQLDLRLRRDAMTPLQLEVVPVKYVKAESVLKPLQNLLQQSSREEGAICAAPFRSIRPAITSCYMRLRRR